MKQIIAISFLIMLVSACGDSKLEEKSAINQNVYTSIEIIDSVRIEYLGEAKLWDVSPDDSKLLFRDWQREEFLIVNREGDIISSFSKEGDVMDSHGYLIMTASFWDNETILAGGLKGLFFYSLEGEMLRKVNFADIPEVQMFYSSPGFHFQQVQLDMVAYVLGGALTPNAFTKMDPEYYKERKSLSLIDLDSGRIEGLVNLEPDSRYFDGKVYEESHVLSYFKVVDDKIWVVHAGDPRLLIYELERPHGKVMDIPLNLIGLELPQGISPQEADPNSWVMDGGIGGVKAIQQIGDKIALLYYQGMKKEIEDEIDPLWETDRDKALELFNAAKKKIDFRVQIWTKEGAFEGDFILPKSFSSYEFIGTSEEFIWLVKAPNEEEEEEFITVYKVKLTTN